MAAKPTFLIIGAMKCGTTSLHHYLRLHPEIQIPLVKEPNYFSGPPGRFPYPLGSKRIETLVQYEDLFDSGVDVRGEASPNYALYPQRTGVPERIKETVPDAKLIYLVRDPVERAVSQYHLHVSTVGEQRPLREALGDLSDQYSPYTCPGFYAKQLDRYLEHFSQGKILIIDQADLLKERGGTLRRIFSFLEVDEFFDSPGFDEEMNAGRDHRSFSKVVAFTAWARTTPLQRLPRGLRVFMRRSAENVMSKPLETPTLDVDLRERLVDLYAGDAARLRSMTGMRFASWSV
jgi:Sulfotransferase domain